MLSFVYGFKNISLMYSSPTHWKVPKCGVYTCIYLLYFKWLEVIDFQNISHYCLLKQLTWLGMKKGTTKDFEDGSIQFMLWQFLRQWLSFQDYRVNFIVYTHNSETKTTTNEAHNYCIHHRLYNQSKVPRLRQVRYVHINSSMLQRMN